MFRHFLIFPLFILITCHGFAESPVCVTAPKATMRAEPNSKSPVTWVVTQNMPLMRLEKKGSWTHVEDVDGEKHWISSSAVTGRVACAVIRSKTARLRTAPGSTAPLAEMPIADKYTPFRRIGGESDFVQVQDDYGEQYWVTDKSIWYPVTKMQIHF